MLKRNGGGESSWIGKLWEGSWIDTVGGGNHLCI